MFDKKPFMLGDSSMDIKKQLGNVPWITKEGFLDPAQFPIDSVLKQALSDDDRQLRSGLNMLGAMYVHGRSEAGVFLLGLLVNCDDNWEKRIKIVEAMKGIDTKPCADLLFSELKRVKSSNTTRLYLGAVIKVLSDMPSELIEDGFKTLAEDRSFSPKMRDKFRAVLEKRLFEDHGW
ncbi:MAG: hypothetical protein WB773_13805 [Isosphaeraceae bacterium]